MWNKYQQYADEQHGRVQSSQMPVVGQGIYPGAPYQEWADTFHTRTINDATAHVPFAPVQEMAQGSQAGANRFPGRIRSAEQLALNGLGYWRRSGSMARAARVVGGLGADPAPMDYEKSCANFDAQAWVPPMFAFIYGHPDFVKTGQASQATNDAAAAQFGASNMVCMMYGLATKKVDVSKYGPDAAERLKQAGIKMHANGWWAKDNWMSYFDYWSGWNPWYKNPYYLGGGGAVLLAGTWWFLRRKKH